ncbi:vitamin K epoxide reductase family protein [Chryseobacterium lacus]|nr:vitamin K epoxide reductase family protein [Chryseobacterium lacus]
MPSEFITLYQNNFALIRRFNDKVNVLIDKEEIISFKELKKNSQKFILLFEKSSTENAARTHHQPRQILLFLLIVILLLGNIISWNPWAFVFQVLSLTGVYIFLEIFREKSGSESPVLQSVCGSISKQSSSDDTCNKIIKSKDFQFLGLTFSDFGLSYFLGLSILTLLIEKNSYLLVLITGLSLHSIIYSAYYQISKKSFCRVCGVVIIILISQFFIALFNFQTRIVLTEAIIAAFVFLLAFYIIHFLSETISEKENYRKENIKNLKFKKNYGIFKNQLQSKDRILFENSKAGFSLEIKMQKYISL